MATLKVKRNAICACLLATVVAAAGCGAGRQRSPAMVARRAKPVQIVARIGTETITDSELRHWMTVARSSVVLPQRNMLEVLIRARWVFDEAREAGVKVANAQVQEQLEELSVDESEGVKYAELPRDVILRRLLEASGVRAYDKHWLMKLTLMMPQVEEARLSRAQRDVSQGRVRRYYESHRRRFFLPHQRLVEIIGGEMAAVMEAKREVERGEPFLEAAKLSRDPEAPGGLWRLVEGRDERNVERPVFAAKLHKLVGPLQSAMFYIFEALEDFPAHEQTLAEAEGVIRRELAPSKREIASEAEANWAKRTECSLRWHLPECGK